MLKESKRVKTQRSKSVKQTRKTKSNQRLETNQLLNKINLSIINDVTDNDGNNDGESLKKPVKLVLKDADLNNSIEDIYTQFATLFFKNPNVIMIPTKVKTLIERNLPNHYLDKIHGGEKSKENREVAVELCLLFLSQLSSTHRNILNGESLEGWKSLRAEYLRQLLRIDDQTYQHVKIALLQFQYDEESILEERFYVIGEHSYEYRLGESFRSKGFKPYGLKTQKVQELFKRSCDRKIKMAQNNIICINLIEFYKTITLPTEEEIEDEADRLIKEGYETKKGKRLIRRNKKGSTYFTDVANLSFVEDALKVFRYLTKNGLMIPRPGNEKSGGRIVDSFTLMPSWIRKLIRVNGKPIAEADYSCLHPNIAMSLYGGRSQFLTHDCLSVVLGVDKGIVKVEHLTFFNKKVKKMRQSPLFDYYSKNEPSMLYGITSEKQKSEYGHKITSRRLFAKEVEIMKEVIKRLNEQRFFVGYIYDALFFDPLYSDKVVEVMNEVAIELSVFTTAKLE